MRNRPCSNLRETARAKSRSEDWKDDADTAHIILVEATCRQIYPAAPPLRYGWFRNARVCRLPSLSRGVGHCRRAAITRSVCRWPILWLLRVAPFREISATGRTERHDCLWRPKVAARIASP